MREDKPETTERNGRLPYHPPSIDVLGSVAELTATGATSGSPDSSDTVTSYTSS